MKSSELAKQAGVNLETIRYYERTGLLPQAKRRLSGYRVFTEADAVRLRFIKRAQELGFTLKEIKELLALRATGEADRSQVKELAAQKIQDISLRIRDLLRMKETLQEIAGQCDGHGGTAECPILHALEDPVSCHPNHNPKRSKNL